jgi:hypothetical protein
MDNFNERERVWQVNANGGQRNALGHPFPEETRLRLLACDLVPYRVVIGVCVPGLGHAAGYWQWNLMQM